MGRVGGKGGQGEGRNDEMEGEGDWREKGLFIFFSEGSDILVSKATGGARLRVWVGGRGFSRNLIVSHWLLPAL